MKWTFFFGTLLFLCGTLSGCVGYNACGPYYGPNTMGAYSPGMMHGGGSCDPCNSCSNVASCGVPSQSFNYAYGGGAACHVGQAAVHAVETPLSWFAQILRGTQYPCNGCGDEVYWGDYGLTPDDYCDPCTYEGRWGGRGCGDCGQCVPCQRGLAYRYPSMGTMANQALAPAFQDKVAHTHAQIPMDYGIRGRSGQTYCEPCESEFEEGEYVESYSTSSGGCPDGSCGVVSRNTITNPKIARTVPATQQAGTVAKTKTENSVRPVSATKNTSRVSRSAVQQYYR